MKLNYDCVRDLLLYLEENLTYENDVVINNISIKNYTEAELVYTAEKLYEANYLNCMKPQYIDEEIPSIIVLSLTYSGHQFLDTVRDNAVWDKTKKLSSSIASTSLKILENIATNVITNIISKQIGLS